MQWFLGEKFQSDLAPDWGKLEGGQSKNSGTPRSIQGQIQVIGTHR